MGGLNDIIGRDREQARVRIEELERSAAPNSPPAGGAFRFNDFEPPQLLKEMTSSAAFRCVQAWLLEKPAAWADDPCLAAAQMAQRPSNKPREDALLEAERSHQRRRIEILDAERSHKRRLIAHLEVQQAKVKRLEERLRDLVKSRTRWTASLKRLFTARPRAPSGQSLPCAGLRLMLRGTWSGYFRTSGDRQAPRSDPTMRSSSVSGRRSCRLSETL